MGFYFGSLKSIYEWIRQCEKLPDMCWDTTLIWQYSGLCEMGGGIQYWPIENHLSRKSNSVNVLYMFEF